MTYLAIYLVVGILYTLSIFNKSTYRVAFYDLIEYTLFWPIFWLAKFLTWLEKFI